MPLCTFCGVEPVRDSLSNRRPMTPSDQYRIRAAQFRARARVESNPQLSAEWNHLAQCYLRLAEHAGRYSQLDIVYETPLTSTGRREPPADESQKK
jgi:hypothetical protein